jgi:hypothetical protein
MNTEFPKWKYSPTGANRIVHDPDEEAALGSGWADHPFPAAAAPAAEPPAPAAPAPCPECAKLRIRITEMQKMFDHAYAELLTAHENMVKEVTELRIAQAQAADPPDAPPTETAPKARSKK